MKKIFSFILCMVMMISFVTTANAIKSVPVKSIKLDKSAVTLEIGKTYTLKLTFTPANTTQKLVKYTTSNKNVATVDAKGKITAVKTGKVVISVTSTSNKKISAICNITVPEKIDPFGKYKKPITLTTVKQESADTAKYAEGEDVNNNMWTKLLSDELGIQIKYLWVAPTMEVWQQKMNISIATNNIPDFAQLKDEQYVKCLDTNLLADITDVYGKYKTDLFNAQMTRDKITMDIASYKGRIYCIPQITSQYEGSALLWVRSDWLKNVGLNQPKTMDELITVIKAFTKNDPDKNNKNDTYGIAVNQNVFKNAVGSLKGFFEGYHAYIQSSMWILKDGKLQFGGIQPEVKKALATLAGLFKEGCIDPEFGVKSDVLVGEDFAKGKLGLTFGVYYAALTPLNATKTNFPQCDINPYPIVSKDNKPALTSGATSALWYTAVSKKCKNPEAVIKIANLECKMRNADPVTVNKYFGTEGYGALPFNTPGDLNENYTNSKLVINAMKTNDTSKLFSGSKGYYDSCIKWVNDNKNANIDTDWATYKTFAEGSSWNVIGKEYIEGGRMFTSEFYGAPTKGMGERKAALEKLQIETFVKIITGHDDISAFDTFVDEWKKVGGDQITSEVNAWYKAKSK